MNRRKKLGVIAAAAGILLLTPVTVLAEDKWESKNGGRYRVKEDGTYYAGEWFPCDVPSISSLALSGKPSTAWYYAGEDGKIYVNGWYEINGKTYYFYAGGNAAVNSNFCPGWKTAIM